MSLAPIELLDETDAFIVGTTGWTADDLDDPAFERFWDSGRYEIVEGVLAQMPPAYFDGSRSLFKLMMLVEIHVQSTGMGVGFAPEADVILTKLRVPKADAVYLSDEELHRQQAANAKSKRPRGKYGRIRIAPTLIIESVSQGHESHDRITKARWYADAGIRNYWILDAFKKTLECFVLDGDEYRVAQKGKRNEKMQTKLFPGLVIDLAEIWA